MNRPHCLQPEACRAKPAARPDPRRPKTHVLALARMPVGSSIYVADCLGRSLSACANRLCGKGWMAMRKEGLGYRLTKKAEPLRIPPEPELPPLTHCRVCAGKVHMANLQAQPGFLERSSAAGAAIIRNNAEIAKRSADTRLARWYANNDVRPDEIETYKALRKKKIPTPMCLQVIANSRRA